MRFKTVRDILDCTAAFHQRVGQLAGDAADRQDQERLILLLDYLADHETAVRKALMEFENDVPEGLLSTWFDRSPEIKLPSLVDESAWLANAVSIDDVVSRVVEFHNQMVEIFTNLSEQTNNEKIRDMFDNLANHEEHEKLRLIRGAQQLGDL